MHNFFALILRPTTTGPREIEVALVDGDIFLGWLTEGNKKNALQTRLGNGEAFVGMIVGVHAFSWEQGRGTCYCGNVAIWPRDVDLGL